MSAEKMTRFSKLLRPAIFVFAFLLHVAVIFIFNFTPKEEEIETVDFREADIFKLVDVQEYVPPKETKEVVTVSNQPKASENIQEVDETVRQEFDESTFLPQHKISSIPVIPTKQILSRIEYPPMALKQGIEAVVYLELFIDAKGVIKNIKVLKDPGHGFAQAAVSALKGVTCVPAVANGKACAVRFRYPVKFTLN